MNPIIFSLTVFLAGILSFFSPCVFPLLPVYIGILLGSDQEKAIRLFGKKIRWHGLLKTLCFIAGISVIFLLIGFGAGLLGKIMYTNWFRYLMGALIIILGLHQMEVFHFHFLGLGFSFGWTPCIGPVLGSVLALAASDGQDALMGAIYLLIYTLGMALPFLLLALASSLVLPYFNRLKPHLLLLKKIGGAIIILMGILLLLGQLNSLSSIFS